MTVFLDRVGTLVARAVFEVAAALAESEAAAEAEEGVEPADEKNTLCEEPVATGMEMLVPDPPVALATAVADTVKELTGSPACVQSSSSSVGMCEKNARRQR